MQKTTLSHTEHTSALTCSCQTVRQLFLWQALGEFPFIHHHKSHNTWEKGGKKTKQGEKRSREKQRPWGPEISSDPFLSFFTSSAQRILTRASSSTPSHEHTRTHNPAATPCTCGQHDPYRGTVCCPLTRRFSHTMQTTKHKSTRIKQTWEYY